MSATQQADAHVIWKAERNYKDTKNNICHAVNNKLKMAVPDAYKSKVMAVVGQGRNYPAHTNPQDAINKLCKRYGKATPTEKKLNNKKTNAPWNMLKPMEAYFWLVDCIDAAIRNSIAAITSA